MSHSSMGNVVSCQKTLQSLIARFLDSVWWARGYFGSWNAYMNTLVFTEPSQYILHVSSPHSYCTCVTCVYMYICTCKYIYINTCILWPRWKDIFLHIYSTVYMIYVICESSLSCRSSGDQPGEALSYIAMVAMKDKNRKLMNWCNLMLFVWM